MAQALPKAVSFRLLSLAIVLGSAISGSAALAQPAGPNPRIIETQCRSCHARQFASQAGGPHSVLDSEESIGRTGLQPGCLNCHGDASEHIAARGGQDNIRAFRDEAPGEIIETCLDCHASSHPEFERSPHALAGLSCVSCHSQHGAAQPQSALLREAEDALGKLERATSATRLCADCHDDVLAAFELNERHRLLEGAIDCTSCHDPHVPATRTLLGGFKQEPCLDCHTDKGGPFVFEHAANRVEGCTGCHSPHGSPNRHLLGHQRVAELCIDCHATIPQFHVGFNPAAPPRFSLDTQCTNCHSAIHGSNFDPRFLR